MHAQLYNCINRKSAQTSVRKNLKFSVLVGTAIKKTLKQVAEMKHELSVCILIPTLAVLYPAIVGIKMHSVRVSSQLLVSGLFIAVLTNTRNLYTC